MSEGNQKHISLIIKNPLVKERYFSLLKDVGRIPTCLNCGKLFEIGFPNTEEGASDNLICNENDMVCTCEYMSIVKNLYNSKEDGVIDIAQYYHTSPRTTSA